MQLAPMRYTKIEGTAVAVSVTSAAQAKAAVQNSQSMIECGDNLRRHQLAQIGGDQTARVA